jgi:hypothetical protein
MVWLNCSPVTVGMRGVFCSFKLFLPAFPRVEEGGVHGGRHPVLSIEGLHTVVRSCRVKSRVADPDPSFEAEYRYGSGSNPDLGFDDQKLKKIHSWKKNCWIKNYNLPIFRPAYRTSKLQKKASALKREHPALQNMKFQKNFYFCGSFLPSWIRIH